MPSSRVVFVGAISVILGFYVIGLRTADGNHQSVALTHMYQLQANEIAMTGLDYAVNRMGRSYNGPWDTGVMPFFEGTLRVEIENSGLPVGQARIRTRGTYKTHEARFIAILKNTPISTNPPHIRKKRWYWWEVETVYPEIRKDEFRNIYTNLQRYANAQ